MTGFVSKQHVLIKNSPKKDLIHSQYESNVAICSNGAEFQIESQIWKRFKIESNNLPNNYRTWCNLQELKYIWGCAILSEAKAVWYSTPTDNTTHPWNILHERMHVNNCN